MKQRGADLPQLFPTSVFLNVEDSIHVSTFKATAVKKESGPAEQSTPQGNILYQQWPSSLLPFRWEHGGSMVTKYIDVGSVRRQDA